MQRLAEVDGGNEASPLPAAPATDTEVSKERSAAIRRMAKTLFP